MSELHRSSPLTVEEAAKILKVSKYTLYELIKRGEIPVQRIGRQIRIDPGSLVSHTSHSAASDNISPLKIQFIGSHEPVVELLADFLSSSSPPSNLALSFDGSMIGLLALYRRQCQISGIHLWDEKTESYNLPFVDYALPGESVILINLVQRVQGLIVQPGNPLQLRSIEDLQQAGVRFINRQKGSGTRLRLDASLREGNISSDKINGYENEVQTHYAVASYVANNKADVGIGVQSAAYRMGLDFVPLFNERYDLIAHKEITKTTFWQSLTTILNSHSFKIAIARQVGYDTSLTGKILYETP